VCQGERGQGKTCVRGCTRRVRAARADGAKKSHGKDRGALTGPTINEFRNDGTCGVCGRRGAASQPVTNIAQNSDTGPACTWSALRNRKKEAKGRRGVRWQSDKPGVRSRPIVPIVRQGRSCGRAKCASEVVQGTDGRRGRSKAGD